MLGLFTSNPVVDGILGSAGLLAAVGVIWRKVRGLIRMLGEIHDKTEVLSEIAEEFKPNNGSSLRDRVDDLNTKVHELEDGQVTLHDGQVAIKARIEEIESDRQARAA